MQTQIIKDHIQFIGLLGKLGFKTLDINDWVAKLGNVYVTFVGNDKQPWLGDIVVKNGFNELKHKIWIFHNYDLTEYDDAMNFIKELINES